MAVAEGTGMDALPREIGVFTSRSTNAVVKLRELGFDFLDGGRCTRSFPLLFSVVVKEVKLIQTLLETD